MATSGSDLSVVKAKVLEKVMRAARSGDVAAVARWSQAAERCEALAREAAQLEDGIRDLVSALEAPTPVEPPAADGYPGAAGSPRAPSPKREGAGARSEWVGRLSGRGIALQGHGKKYLTAQRRVVGLAFASERRPNKWFLGLVDEHFDVIVLLCRDSTQRVHDIIIPVEELGARWKVLSRSDGEVKFNVRRDASGFSLLIPGSSPHPVTKYIGNVRVLGSGSV